MKAFVFLGFVVLCIGAFVIGAQAQACYQCIPTDDHQPPSSWQCLPGMYIGWASCLAGPSCNTHDQCGVGGGGCFLAGTQVATPSGSTSIEDLRVGDEVLSETDEGEQVSARVSRTYHTIQLSYYVINGTISVTATHPFWIDERWVEVKDIQLGDRMTSEDGSETVVASIEPVDFGVRVYNIEVDDTHTFFADGILVHNKPPDPDGIVVRLGEWLKTRLLFAW